MALFEALSSDENTRAIVVEDFNAIAVFIAEEIEVSGVEFAAVKIFNYCGEAVEAFTQIGGGNDESDFEVVRSQVKHDRIGYQKK